MSQPKLRLTSLWLTLAAALPFGCAHGLSKEQDKRLAALEESHRRLVMTSEENQRLLKALATEQAKVATGFGELVEAMEGDGPPGPPPEDPNKVHAVALGDSPSRGPAVAKVTIVEFSDFQCPFCSRAGATVDALLKAHPDAVRLVYKNLPLPFHPRARPAALAALAAGRQGKFWEMHDKLFTNQRTLEQTDFEAHARALKLNMKQFKADLGDDALAAAVTADETLAQKVGARGTPTFFINGRKLVGAQPLPAFEAIYTEELTKAEAMLAAGVAPKDLYDKILEKAE